MGFKTELNWALKLKLGLQDLKINKVYSFSKDEYRVYPIGIPIDLINDKWEAVAKVIIIEAKNSDEKTTGKYKILRLYEGKEKEVLTKYWRETVEYIKGEKITDFFNVKL